MKIKRISNKLNLNKTTVANLLDVKGGGIVRNPLDGRYTCLAGTCFRTDFMCEIIETEQGATDYATCGSEFTDYCV